jgi:serine/threonine-protein kinase
VPVRRRVSFPFADDGPARRARRVPISLAPDASDRLPLESLTQEAVPDHVIEKELGRGGMGVVYRARQVKLDRTVALKMILHAEHAGEDERRRFLNEAQALACLQHPNIVQIHEVGESPSSWSSWPSATSFPG